jgi:soluble lytic murein transglycosylase-like protein
MSSRPSPPPVKRSLLSALWNTAWVRRVRHALAMLGFLTIAAAVLLALMPGWRTALQEAALAWLQEAHLDKIHDVLYPALSVTAVDPERLPADQRRVALWLAKKYRLAPEPMAAMVRKAHLLGLQYNLPSNLILAVAGIESGFHPYVQSSAGAQGVMQVLTPVHEERFEAHGGIDAAFDPLVSLQVGAQVLRDAIKLRGGSVEDGLRFYLAGDKNVDDGGYVEKVLAEQARLDAVAAGQPPVSQP